MKEVKDVTKLILLPHEVLIEIHKASDITESGIIIPEQAREKMPSVAVVIKCGGDVTDLKPSDIILELHGGYSSTVEAFKHNEKFYSTIHRNVIRLATPADNYDKQF